MIKKCEVCGKEFEFRQGNRKYCSKECARIKLRKQQRQHYKKHKKELVKKCEFCNKEFKTRNSKRKYCSTKCYKASRKEYKHQYYQEHKEILLERQRQRRRQQYIIDPRCTELGLSCFECPYEDCRY